MRIKSQAGHIRLARLLGGAAALLLTPAGVLAQACSDPNVVCLFATNVPDVCGWDFEQRAQDAPASVACDDSAFPYAVQSADFVSWATNCTNSGGACSANFNCSCGNLQDCECFLEAAQFDGYSLPPGTAIRAVMVDVRARYNQQTSQCNADSGRIRARVDLPSLSRSITRDSEPFSNGLGDDTCAFRLGALRDITFDPTLGVATWTAGLINDLQVAVRRLEDGGRNTALRVSAFRIMVVHCSDCNGDGQCDSCEGRPDGTACETDNNACTRDICIGQCCSHPGIVCNDSNACTNDSCNFATGCVYSTNPDPCSDSNACTTNDRCNGGACASGSPLNTDDQNPCTDDSCNPATGVVHANNTAPCNDGDACTTNDTCSGGVCHGGPPANCEDGNACTDDSCVPVTGCVRTNNTVPCNDGNLCTTNDRCNAGACVSGPPLICDDANFCTGNSCNPSTGCVFAPNVVSCNDGNACTTNDRCTGGTCVGGPAPICNDLNFCTNDSCNPVTGCVYTTNFLSCNDGNPCTTNDRCQSRVCIGTNETDCDDGNPCTNDSCNPATVCTHTNNTLACNDGNACTTNDTCGGGVCVGGPAPVCNDGNFCTDDSCNPATGCVLANNTALCNDGNSCTTNDRCNGGNCAGGLAPNCNDGNPCTNDSCNPATGCVRTNNTAPCNDGNACTNADACLNGTCHAGPARNCNDGNPCTNDSCNPATGCVRTNNTAPCNDGNLCTTGDTCAGGQCRSGSPVMCGDDGLFCNGVETCNLFTGECASIARPCSGATSVCCEDSESCVGQCLEGGSDFDADDDEDVDLFDYAEFQRHFGRPR